MTKITILRKGQPIQVDKQIILWRKRRQKKALLARRRREVLELAYDVFGEDAMDWVENTKIPRFKYSTPETLLKNNKFKGLVKYLKSLKHDKN